jgi:tetratricopeptide (TPR) repeat protein
MKTAIIIIVVTFALAIVAARAAFAETGSGENRPCDDMLAFNETAIAKAQLVRLLQARKFNEIEREIETRYQRVLGNGVRELHVFGLLDFVESGDPAFEPWLNEWVRGASKSAWPLVVRAQYWKAIGWKKRGNKFSNETTPEQFESFGVELEKATSDLEQALQLDPKNVMTYAMYLNASKSPSGKRTTTELLKTANKIAPKNFVVRHTAIYMLSPRWSGSFEEMDAIADDAKKADVNNVDVMRLRYSIERAKGSHYRQVEKNYAQAIASFERAIKICDGRGAWNDMVKISTDKKDWPLVESAATQLLRVWPDRTYAYEQRAWAKEQLGRVKEAIPDYERAARGNTGSAGDTGGSAWAQQRLALHYIEGKNVAKDLVGARELLEKAAAKGQKGAKENLEKLIKLQAQK